MALPGWIASTRGALGEMAFQDVTAGEGIVTKTASVRPGACIYSPVSSTNP